MVPKAAIPLRYAWFGKRWRAEPREREREMGEQWESDRQTDRQEERHGGQNVAWCVIRPHTLCISRLLLWSSGWTGALKGKCIRQWQQSFVTSVDTSSGGGGGNGGGDGGDVPSRCSSPVKTCSSSQEPFSAWKVEDKLLWRRDASVDSGVVNLLNFSCQLHFLLLTYQCDSLFP